VEGYGDSWVYPCPSLIEHLLAAKSIAVSHDVPMGSEHSYLDVSRMKLASVKGDASSFSSESTQFFILGFFHFASCDPVFHNVPASMNDSD
jgi:hypothetical protein